MGNKLADLQDKLDQWQTANSSYLQEIKTAVTRLKTPQYFQIISYFTYSLNVSHDSDLDSICLGNFYIENLGNQPLEKPYICLKISEGAPFEFSGRYVYETSKLKRKTPDAWERINDQTNKEEYWLRPLGKQTLLPGDKLHFSNFQLKWLAKGSYSGSLMGFIYGDQVKEGRSALNQINISGTAKERGEEHE
ncbi:hypothetical protein [Thalassobacillus pellis]|uniref:hypothetical protein n=1 Tax=Thalassobacillus pellis TaxID=748008 RepID=UPI00195FCD4D|nr:hypothetical protein [Thalassobacillus pellis]MBM7553621.1 hypothetical protein [Thalassobacillus pellis]